MPGRYVLQAIAKATGKRSRSATASFTILVPPATCNGPDPDGDCDTPGQT
jgi:hypothetical protein